MRTLAAVALLAGCWTDNPGYRPPPDMVVSVPDLSVCAALLPGGGGGRGRPEVLVPGGPYVIEGLSFSLPDFYLDVFLVTVGAYRDCMSVGGCSLPAAGPYCNLGAAPGTREDHPVNCVTWLQAQTFCQWAGRRLPGEGEWQYAAAGKRMSPYPWGDDDPRMGAMAQVCWDQYGKSDLGSTPLSTCPVGSHGRTLLGARTCDGVADLSGNVWEWTASEYHDPYLSPEPSCSASSMDCSLRGGGSWYDINAQDFRVTARNSDNPSDGLASYGFRCARTK